MESRGFALSTLILVIVGGICLHFWPQSWIWALLPPVIMSISRLVVKPASFHTPLWTASVLVFIATAAIGYAVAYNETVAWNKFCLVVVAVLLYINIATQPVENLKILARLVFLAGIGIASSFLLTADFSALAVKFKWIHALGVAWMNVRPDLFQLPSIPANDTAGILIITAAYGLPLWREFRGKRRRRRTQRFLIRAALGIILVAVVLASSRGALLALLAALGIWFTSRLLQWLGPPLKEKLASWFPFVVLAGVLALEAVVLFLPAGMLGPSLSASDNVYISRAEVFRSGLMILGDFPFTGGGLASFPGLYSQYVLAMPFSILPHSHNMILDVMIEQGVLGGIAFVVIYLMSVRQLLLAANNASVRPWYLAACISLFTALFHGMVDDYLYGSSGPALSLIPAGMAMLVSRLGEAERSVQKPEPPPLTHGLWISRQYSFPGIIVIIVLSAFLWRSVAAQWYANMGAVRMAKVELAGFPTGKWSEGQELSRFGPAELDFERALGYHSDNKTANHRLGLIRMTARDYQSAAEYLEKAYQKDPADRGVIKNLGYSYLWLGETEKARSLLYGMPEIKHELENYVWWWNDRQRPDLSDRASQLADSIVTRP
jgi:O-antigen ligase